MSGFLLSVLYARLRTAVSKVFGCEEEAWFRSLIDLSEGISLSLRLRCCLLKHRRLVAMPRACDALWGHLLRFGEEALDEDGEGVGGAFFGGDGEVRRGGADAFGLKEEERGLYLPM